MFNTHKKTFRKEWKIFFPFLLVILFLFLSAVVMFLWNAILPALLNVNQITYLQSSGLLLLCRILFGSFRFGNHGGYARSGYLKDKWMNMSDEEKIKFREEWKKRCAERKDK